MTKQKQCPYCKETIIYFKGRQFSSHCANCKKRPRYREGVEKQRQSILNKRKDYVFNCPKCNKLYTLNLTPIQLNKRRYKKFCSRSCANSRKLTKEIKAKISRALIKYTPEEKIKIKRERQRKLNTKYRELKTIKKYQALSNNCYICKRIFPKLMAHRKDGKIHKDLRAMGKIEFNNALQSKEYVHLCYRCHKGVHFCMDILHFKWKYIINIIK